MTHDALMQTIVARTRRYITWLYRAKYGKRAGLVVLLTCLLLPALAHAETLMCPFDVELDDAGIPVRTVALNRSGILTSLRAELGTTGTPWTDETEIAGALRTGANRLRVTIAQWPTLTQDLRTRILNAGCSLVAPDFGAPGRVPRVVDGQLVFDADDTTREVIKRTRAQQSSLWYRMPRYALDWLSVPAAWAALSDGPETSVLDNCNRTENPLVGPTGVEWAQTRVLSATATSMQANGSACLTISTSGSWWQATTFGPADEAFATFPTVSGSTSFPNKVWLGLITPGTTGADGYTCGADQANDQVQLHRADNSTLTALGSPVSVSFDAGDGLLIRRLNGVLTCHWKDGANAWVIVKTEVESTYTIAGNIGADIHNSSFMDNFGGGTLPAAGGGSLGRWLLR